MRQRGGAGFRAGLGGEWFHRLRRVWVRSALALGLVAGGAFALGSLLLEPDPPPRLPAVRPRPVKPPAPPPVTAAELGPGATAATVAAVASARTPEERVVALQRLERVDAVQASAQARRLLADPAPFVRLNAIAVLARHGGEDDQVLLASLDPRSRALAVAVRERGK